MTRDESKILNGLRGAAIFKHLHADQLNGLVDQTDFMRYNSEEIIVTEGDPGDRLYIIMQGIVKIKKEIPNHPDKVLAYLLPGNTFGELGILENKPRSATVQALTDVEVLYIERESFIRILHEHPSITIELAKLLGHYLTESNKRLTQGGREKRGKEHGSGAPLETSATTTSASSEGNSFDGVLSLPRGDHVRLHDYCCCCLDFCLVVVLADRV